MTPDMRDDQPKFNLIENETYEDAVQRRVEAMDALGEYIPPPSTNFSSSGEIAAVYVPAEHVRRIGGVDHAQHLRDQAVWAASEFDG
ncbi:hypothetical protein ACFV2X_10770 [Streptomyces sp. NPDC059679]|uniref:hypothetical protein n=1 Tax=Streptomyces sp. NPDC059679 TaxID=3346903 RepID=UPI00369A8BA4